MTDSGVKPSRYNYSLDLGSGPTVFFNYFSLALIGHKPAASRLAKQILSEPDEVPETKRTSQLRQLFVDHGFLVDDRRDETGYLKLMYARAATDNTHVSLTIVPTLSCNFACRYCYQEKTREVMIPEVEDALIRYVRERVTVGGRLSITWFGGEPLLRMDTIERLSAGFLDICAERSAKYTASIITNGYLLTGETSRRLAELGVKEAQITLDGPPGVHDVRRPLAGGGATFRTILGNIRMASPDIRINVRMNVDGQNRRSIPDILDLLAAEGLQNRLGIYLGQTFPYTTICHDVTGWCLRDDDFSLLELETGLAMSHRGFQSYGLPQSRDRYCMAERENAFAVIPSGGMVKCWNEVTTPGAETRHLLRPATAEMRRREELWKSRNPFLLECRDCRCLPICMGGCPYIHRTTGNLHCHPWKHHPDENLVFYYYLKKRNQESEVLRQVLDILNDPKAKPPTRSRRKKAPAKKRIFEKEA